MFEVIFHYGDTGFEENLSGDVYATEREAKYVARKNNEFMDDEDQKLGDYYYVKEVK